MSMSSDLRRMHESSSRLLNSYCIRPNARFESQHENEEVLLLVRAHPATLVPALFTTALMGIIPIIVNIVLVNYVNSTELIVINIFWYSMIFSYLFWQIFRWMYNVGIVTNERIVDVDFTMIIRKQLSGTSLAKVTDVTERTSGFVRSLFQYGDVYVQTAGEEQNIEFHAVPDPVEIVSIINKLME